VKKLPRSCGTASLRSCTGLLRSISPSTLTTRSANRGSRDAHCAAAASSASTTSV
jgi:hypothetical protein